MARERVLALLLACCLAPRAARGADVDVFSVLPLTPETASRLHVSVDGLFGGVLTPDPVLPSARFSSEVPKRYAEARVYAKALHAARLRVGGHVHGTQLVPEVAKAFPGLEQDACRDAKGGVPYFDKSQDGLFMCANNPAWRRFEAERGARAIDAGVDYVMIDEVQGNALALNPAVGSPGFCPFCREGFARFMKEEGKPALPDDWAERVGWSSIFKRRLADKIAREPLVGDFLRFQTRAQYAALAEVVASLRAHARASGRDVKVAANVSFLDSFSVLDFWFRGLFLSDLLDLTVFEVQYNPSGEVTESLALPRGKWVAWQKLADATSRERPVGLVSAPTIGRLTKEAYGSGPNRSEQLAALFAEAYAQGSSLAFYTLELPGLDPAKLWGPMAQIAAFVRAHADLYSRDLQVPTDVAILYRDGAHMAKRNHAYLGIAQALAEANVPFRVVFVADPDAHPKVAQPAPLDAAQLRGLRTVFIPSALDLSPREVALVRSFVDGGGRAVVWDAEAFGLAPAQDAPAGPAAPGGFVPLGSVGEETDPATRFYLDYRAEDRAAIANAAGGTSGALVSLVAAPSDVLLYPYRDPASGRLVVHVVNYRYDAERDRIAPVPELRLRLRGDASLGGKATLLRAGQASTETLDLEPVTGAATGSKAPPGAPPERDVSLQNLETYAVLVVEAAGKPAAPPPGGRTPPRTREGSKP